MGTHYGILAWRITWTEKPGGLQLIAEELMLSNCGDGEDSWESLEDQGVKPVNPKGNQPWTFIEGLMVKLELQYFGHLMWRADSLEKTLSDAGKDWGQEEKWATEDEMVEWHHQPNDMSLSNVQEIVKDRKTWCAVVDGVTKSWAT